MKVFICFRTAFDGLYVAATLLNPAYRKILTSTQVDAAKAFLKLMMPSDSSDN